MHNNQVHRHVLEDLGTFPDEKPLVGAFCRGFETDRQNMMTLDKLSY